MRIIAPLSILYCLSSSYFYSAPLISSPVPVDKGRGEFYIASDGFYYYGPFDLYTAGLRYGFDGWDAGLRMMTIRFAGFTGDVKIKLSHNDPFTITTDLGVGSVDNIWQVNFSVYLDVQIDNFVAVYLTSRWEYPPVIAVDTSYDESMGYFFNPDILFSPRVGVEFFRGFGFSVMFEAGFIESSTGLDFSYAFLAGIRI
jgi:hypothetical protein